MKTKGAVDRHITEDKVLTLHTAKPGLIIQKVLAHC